MPVSWRDLITRTAAAGSRRGLVRSVESVFGRSPVQTPGIVFAITGPRKRVQAPRRH